jgi:hypothetical protein
MGKVEYDLGAGVEGSEKKIRTNDGCGIYTDVARVEGRVNELKIQQDFFTIRRQ